LTYLANSINGLPGAVLIGEFLNVDTPSITLTNVAYNTLQVVFYGIRATTTNQFLQIKFSDDNGSTFLNTCSFDRRNHEWNVAMPPAAIVTTGVDSIDLCELSSNGSRVASGVCTIDGFISNNSTIVNSRAPTSSISGPLNRFTRLCLGYVQKTAPLNCLRFTLPAQNVRGSVLVYGLRKDAP